MRIGFIGLGAMGRHMALNLQRAGHEVQAHDLRCVEGFPNWKASAAEAVRGCEVLFTSLPGPKEVAGLAAEIGSAIPAGAAWFDLSTNSPEAVRRLEKSLPRVSFLDAPVSGGVAGAEAGSLTIMVGGSQEAFEKATPVLQALGQKLHLVGDSGAGTIVKLANQLLVGINMSAVAEAMVLGVKAGVEPAALFRALRQGASGRKRTFDRLAEHFLPGKYDPAAFSLRLAHKDVSLALELARQAGVPMRIGELALAELDEAMRRGWEGRDCRVAMTLQEERAGVDVRVAPERLAELLME